VSRSAAKPLYDWTGDAACGADPDAMFPAPLDTVGRTAAIRTCLACPVRVACREHAMSIEGGAVERDRYGIAGGLDEAARWRLAQQRGLVKSRPRKRRGAA
jgi:hypothetical protein